MAENRLAMGLLGGGNDQQQNESETSYSLFGEALGQEEEDHTCDVCPEMDLMTRAQGYFACFVLGAFLNMLAMISMWSGDGVTFGLLYTLGEFCLLSGSMFLSQPGAQCKAMWSDSSKAIASGAWLLSLGLILLVVFTIGDTTGGMVLILFLVVIEKMAYLWYTLAFFPGGHWAAKAMLGTICSSLCGSS